MSETRNNTIEIIYTVAVVLAFALLFFANADQQETPDGTVVSLGIGKLFYIPCGIALLCSFFIHRPNDKMNHALNWLIGLAIASTLFHFPSSNNVLEWTVTRFVLAILCFRDIRVVDPRRFVTYVTLLSPCVVIPHYILTNPFGYGNIRYAGFYGDPNFLAIALNLIITVCYLSIKNNKSFIIRLFAVISILGSIPLILVGVSRGGIIGLVIVLFFISVDIYKSSKLKFSILLIIALAISGPVILKMSDTFGFIEARYSNESISDSSGARARFEGIENCINVFSNHPSSIPLGIGPGQTMEKIQKYKKYGYTSHFVIHNTYFGLLYEMGIFSFIFYLLLFWYAFKHLVINRFSLLTGLFASNMFCLFTLPGMCFMPSWIILFFVTNYRISELQYTCQ